MANLKKSGMALLRGCIEGAIVVLGTPFIAGFVSGWPVLSTLNGIAYSGLSVLGLAIAGLLVIGSEMLLSSIKVLQ